MIIIINKIRSNDITRLIFILDSYQTFQLLYFWYHYHILV